MSLALPGLDDCLERRPVYQPQCTHLTMTRVYDKDAACSSCGQPGQYGWLFHCTQDREIEFEKELKEEGYRWNDFGQKLVKNMRVRKGSPEARNDKLSFFEEVTPQQMATYRPDQIATILKQREEVKTVIAREEFRRSRAALFDTDFPPTSFESFTNDSIYAGKWTCGKEEECQYKVCPRCRPACADRAFLSLNAVANGEVPATAVLEFGFHKIGGSPIIHAGVLGEMGERGFNVRGRRGIPEVSSITPRLMMQMLEEQIARYDADKGQAILGRRQVPELPTIANVENRRLPESLCCPLPPNQATSGQRDGGGPRSPSASRETTTLVLEGRRNGNRSNLSAACPFIPRRTRLEQREVLVNNGSGRLTEDDVPRPLYPGESESGPSTPGFQHQVDHDQLLQIFDHIGFIESEDNRLFHFNNSFDRDSQAAGLDNDGDEVTPAPLRVDHGVGITEESVESGLPDIVTQV